MNQNEQQPERTAMQQFYELIDTIAFTSIDQGVHDVVGKEQIKSLIEQFRDTVEKEQIIEARVKQIPDNWPNRTRIGEEYYNEKYGTDGK